MTTRRALGLLAILSVGAWAPGFAAVHPEEGTRTGGALTAEAGVRPLGMGGAFSAVAEGVDALYHNPAGLGVLPALEVASNQRRSVEGITQNQLGAACPLGEATSSNLRQFGGLGASFIVLNYGRFTGRDAAGNPTPDFSAKDVLWTFGYGKSFTDRLSVGVNVKRYRLLISDRKARGNASDIGVLYRLMPGKWNASLAVFNLGNALRYARTDSNLPKYVVGGVAYTPLRDTLTFAVDVVDPSAGFTGYRAGLEWHCTRVLILRTGYNSTYALGSGLTAGLGIQIKQFEAAFLPVQLLTIDYAFVPSSRFAAQDSSALSGEHNVSLTLRFGDR